jgi:hypothetical protein
MSEFRIEKIRRRVTVDMTGGETLEGELFLQPSARYRAGPQHPAELLNEPDPFVPLAVAGDGLVLLAKSQMIRIQFDADDADTDSAGVERAAVEVVFADGSNVSGMLTLETRADRPRLLDFLNDDHQPFLVLESPSGITLINRRAIAKVRERRR